MQNWTGEHQAAMVPEFGRTGVRWQQNFALLQRLQTHMQCMESGKKMVRVVGINL